MTDAELDKARIRIMEALSDLAAAAHAAKQAKLTRFSSDLYYSANRAWHELDGFGRRQNLPATDAVSA